MAQNGNPGEDNDETEYAELTGPNDIPTNLSSEKITLKGLKPGAEYKVSWYRIHGNGGWESTTTLHANLVGRLKPYLPPTDSANIGYAYKLEHVGGIFKSSTSDEEVEIQQPKSISAPVFKVIPNPNDGLFSIKAPSNFEFFQLELFDSFGSQVFNGKIRNNEKFQVQLKPGVYFGLINRQYSIRLVVI